MRALASPWLREERRRDRLRRLLARIDQDIAHLRPGGEAIATVLDHLQASRGLIADYLAECSASADMRRRHRRPAG